MGSTHSGTARRQKALWRYWQAVYEAGAPVPSRQRHAADEGDRAGLTDMPPEILAHVFAALAPLDAAVALARCAMVCRTLHAFCAVEVSRALGRSLGDEAVMLGRSRADARPLHLIGLYDSGESSSVCSVILPILGGICAVPITFVLTDGRRFGKGLSVHCAADHWYGAPLTHADMAFVRRTHYGLYNKIGTYRLFDAMTHLMTAGVDVERMRRRDLCPADTLHLPLSSITGEFIHAQMCMHARCNPWLCDKTGVPQMPPCPTPSTCPRADITAHIYEMQPIATDLSD